MQKPRINQQIRAKEVRVLDPEGKNLGILPLEKALEKARETGLDLIEVSARAVPPVAKITDYGKYLYSLEKKEKKVRKVSQELKQIRITLGISQHDLKLKARKISDFLKEGGRIRLELILPGRTKYLKKEFIEERMRRVLNVVTTPYKEADLPRKTPKGLYVILEPQTKK